MRRGDKLRGYMDKVIYILVLVLSSSGVLYIDGPPTVTEVVGSPEEATIQVYLRNKNSTVWDSWEGKLYKVDLKNKKVEEVAIPKITFGKNLEIDLDDSPKIWNTDDCLNGRGDCWDDDTLDRLDQIPLPYK